MTEIMIMLRFGTQFEMKTMKDYHNLYLKWDLLLLAVYLKNLEIIV